MESGQLNKSSKDLSIKKVSSLGEGAQSTPGNLSSSSSSSSFKDPFEFDVETSKSIEDTTKHDKDHSEDDIPVSSMPRNGQPDGESGPPSSAPSAQVMERTDECATPNGYRIPDYVFSRTKSTAPMEWSTASNESLFSIHMGNMSFTRDQTLWMKSGELGMPGDIYFPEPPTELSNNPSPLENKPVPIDVGERSPTLNNGGFGITEADAAETMREVIRENEEDRSNKGKVIAAKESYNSPRLSHRSDESGASVKSFAFPVLTVDHLDKSGTLKGGAEKQKKPAQQATQPETPKETQPQSDSESPMLQTQTPKQNANAQQNKWLSCFPCCPSCS